MHDLLVIGGGAAGFFAAINAARLGNCRVTLLEAGRSPLAKVKISGGGRCNVTHHCFDPLQLVQYYPRGGQALRGAFSRFQPLDVVKWFEAEGVQLKTEADGRMFPITDDSATIVQALTLAARRAGVLLRTGVAVQQVQQLRDHKFCALVKQQSSPNVTTMAKNMPEPIYADRLLLATGSSPSGYAIAKSLGHELEPPIPSLFTFNIRDPQLHNLAGVSLNSVHLKIVLPDLDQKSISKSAKGKRRISNLEQSGALLITHWGVSGPAVLKLSAWAARELHACQYRATLRLNWLPHLSGESIKQLLIDVKGNHPKKLLPNYHPFDISVRLWEYLVHRSGVSLEQRWADISNRSIQQIINTLIASEYAIAGKGVFKEEFVTCGGIRLADVNFQTMESKLCTGLFFAGEILDIDGITGGFNFQNAWTTAWIAAQGLVSTNK